MAQMRKLQQQREIREKKRQLGSDADEKLSQAFGPAAGQQDLDAQLNFLNKGIETRQQQEQIKATQDRTQQIQSQTERVEQETMGLGEQIAKEKRQLESLRSTRRRTVRSALQPTETLFSVLGRSQRSTLG